MKGASKLSNGKAANHVVKLPDGSVLNRYYDAGDQPREESYREDFEAAKLTKQAPSTFLRNVRAAAESGWDFSSRWFADGKSYHQIITTDLLPVDLNTLLYNLEMAIAAANNEAGNKTKADSTTMAMIVRPNQTSFFIFVFPWQSPARPVWRCPRL